MTVDNGVKYKPKSEQTIDIKPKTIKNNSHPPIQNKKLSQNKKNGLLVELDYSND